MSAQTLMQGRIDAEQLLDDIEYGLRSIKLCGRHGCMGAHAGQLVRAAQAAGIFLDRTADTILYCQGGHGTADRLREAKGIAKETLAETKSQLRDYGGIRQLRLALAESHEFALAA